MICSPKYADILFGTASRNTSFVLVAAPFEALPPATTELSFTTSISVVELFTFCLLTVMVAAGIVYLPSFIALK